MGTVEKQSAKTLMNVSAQWAARILGPIETAYLKGEAILLKGGKIGSWFARDHFALFLLAAVGVLILSPRYLVIIAHLIEKYVLFMQPAKVDTSILPYTPNILAITLCFFLATFILRVKLKPFVFMPLFLAGAILCDGIFDLWSLTAYCVFLLIIFGIAKLPFPRFYLGLCIAAVSLICLYLLQLHDILKNKPIVGIIAFQATLVPMLWYSVYEELPPKKKLNLKNYLVYHSTRILGSPVITYKDLFSSPGQPVVETYFSGMKAIYVALFAALARWGIMELEKNVDASSMTGLPLLIFSYLAYVKGYCKTLVPFNIFIGIARLFGIPIRDNFNYWLLARTPNEHWRRWNILMREWVITYVFYPIMRSKKWLFVAIMASLLVSGALHFVPALFAQSVNWFSIGSNLVYWIINGLSIYLVIKVPILFPQLIDKLNIRSSRAWSVAGVLLTSAFYGVIFYGTQFSSWGQTRSFLERLFSF